MTLTTGKRSAIPYILSLLMFIGLIGCGGGGGGGGGTPNSAPTASSVSITDANGGSVTEGDNLTGTYTYADVNGDTEGTSTYRWLRGGVAIPSAIAVNYTLVTADIGQSIRFEVTPVAATGTTTGSAVVSSAVNVVNTSLATAARGFYEGFATIDVAAGDLTISNPDFKAIVDKNEFNIIYKGTETLLYKGAFTEVTATTFKADVRVYRAGYFLATATISNGTIDAGVSLTGTITGTGDYASSVGDIELTYNNANTLTPPVYTTGDLNSWEDTSSPLNVEFTSTTQVNFVMGASVKPIEFQCQALGFDTSNMVYSQTGRIRKFLTSGLTSCTDNNILGLQFNGYFTNFNDGGTDDDTMMIVFSDDNYAYVGLAPCVSGTGACF